MGAVSTELVKVQAKRKPGPRKAKDVPKVGRITPLVRNACEVLIEGHAKTITDAAKLVGCSREHLSIMLRRPHVEDYFMREKKRRLLGPVTSSRAVAVYAGLLDSESEKIRAQVADRILSADGVLPSKSDGARGVTINNHGPAGYVINLSGDVPAIDVTPDR